jgi:pimeloyl-ACP methyl ester carboxylesterase
LKKQIQLHNTSLIYHLFGEGPAIVLLHGFLESSAIWAEFAAELSRDFMVITVDLPGHGESGVIAETHSMHLMSECVREILKTEQIESVLLCGHSMGGYVAVEFASQYQEIVAGLSFFHSNPAPETEQSKTNRERAIQIVKKQKGQFITSFIPDLFAPCNIERLHNKIEALRESANKMSPEAVIAALSGMKERQSRLNVLVDATFPIQFIAGKQDSKIPTEKIMAAALLPHHAELVLLDQCGHMGHIEAPNTTYTALMDFAEKTLYPRRPFHSDNC